jgi:hypothetical protein
VSTSARVVAGPVTGLPGFFFLFFKHGGLRGLPRGFREYVYICNICMCVCV